MNKNINTWCDKRHAKSLPHFHTFTYDRISTLRRRRNSKNGIFNLRLHIRIYLPAYVRYLCRTKSHLCRSQNKLLIIEIWRILALRKWFTHKVARLHLSFAFRFRKNHRWNVTARNLQLSCLNLATRSDNLTITSCYLSCLFSRTMILP